MVRRAASEGLGTAFLLMAVVGSGIMAERLSGGSAALALLCNTLPTAAALVVLVTIFAPLSGAHFNPAVSLVFALRREFRWRDLAPYVAAQCAGGIAGTVLAHRMFDLAPLVIGTHARSGGGQWLGEIVATFALILTILGGLRHAHLALASTLSEQARQNVLQIDVHFFHALAGRDFERGPTIADVDFHHAVVQLARA